MQRSLKGISCETGDAFFNDRSHQTTIMPAEILFPIYQRSYRSGNRPERKRHGKISLPVQETSERIGQEKKERGKKAAQAGKQGG
ncbi:MAG: hypothetical protein KAU60_16550 [Desulfobacterales bacterium]|nr:hypothetical protein [Desulfobacterales bacterium]